jgi:hypothetical protein
MSTTKLQEATLQHIIDNHDVIMTEVDAYSSLPDDLKEELRGLLATNDPSLLLRHNYRKKRTKRTPSSSSQQHNATAGKTIYDSDSSGSLDDTGTGTMATGQGGREWGEYCLDEEFHDADTIKFQSALEQLRGIVGSEANEELLKDFLLAADMDINRAANYYLNTQIGD